MNHLKSILLIVLFSLLVFSRSFASETTNGGILLTTTSTVLGLSVYGLGSVIGLMEWDDDTAIPAISLLYPAIALTSFFVPYNAAFVDRTPILDSQALMYSFGSIIGVVDGLALACLSDDPDEIEILAPSLILPTLGMSLAGYYSAGPLSISPEDSWVIFLGTLYGVGFSTAATSLFYENSTSFPELNQIGGGLALLSTALSLPGMYFMTRSDTYTAGDLSILFLPVLLGGMAGSAVSTFIPEADYRTYVLSSMIGSAAGFAGGYFLARGYDFSAGSGLNTLLGTLGGGLFGLSFALLFDSTDAAVYTSLVSLGSIAGYGLMYYLARTDGSAVPATNDNRPYFSASSSISIVPLALTAAVSCLYYFLGPKTDIQDSTDRDGKAQLTLQIHPEAIAFYETGDGRYTPAPFLSLKAEF